MRTIERKKQQTVAGLARVQADRARSVSEVQPEVWRYRLRSTAQVRRHCKQKQQYRGSKQGTQFAEKRSK